MITTTMISHILQSFADRELELIVQISYILFILSAIIMIVYQFIDVPYGRYGSRLYGPPVPARLAWFIQELPAFFVPVYLYFHTEPTKLTNTANYVLFLMYCGHYFQRCFIFPFLIRGGKPTPLAVFFAALIFCLVNGYIQGCYLIKYAELPPDWTSHPLFILGVCIFVFGFCINIHSDHILRNLRKPGETHYKIPYGGMFEYVSAANFLGEILEWSGFALAGCSLPSLSFACFTAANLIPRALSHHRWYLKKFKEEYPKNRKAIIPFIL